MNKKLYLPNGYFDFRYVRSLGLPFNFCIGGRGTGKTYGALKSMLDDDEKFMFMRRTQTQTDLINKPEFSPFKAICADIDREIVSAPITKYNSGFYNGEEQDGKIVPVGAALGYSAALSTISNIRGFDASDCKVMIYDEFIPERHERPLKNEASAFFNAYETINRNRELKGKPALQAFCLANANSADNPIFMELNLVNRVQRMQMTGEDTYIDRARGIGIFLLSNTAISAAKQDTALYRLTAGSEFAAMALQNRFADYDTSGINSRSLREYRPIVFVGELGIYEHKNRREYYVCAVKHGGAPEYSTGEADLQRFRQRYSWIVSVYYGCEMVFSDFMAERLLTKYVGIR